MSTQRLAAAFADPPESLAEMGLELSRVAADLADLAETAALGEWLQGPEARIDLPLVGALIEARRKRADHFGRKVSDADWTMMLELFAARLEARRVSQTALCAASGVPATTSLRRIETLCEGGIFTRQGDPRYGRRVYIALSDAAAARMSAYLAAALKVSPLLL
jgi:hypothetical protein